MAAPVIFSKALRARFRSALGVAFPDLLEVYFLEELQDRLSFIKKKFKTILYMGPPLPKVEGFLKACGVLTTYHEAGLELKEEGALYPSFLSEELPYPPQQFDLVVSLMQLHAVNALPSFLTHCRTLLKPDGLFMASFPGEQTLSEVRQACAQVDLKRLGGIYPRVFPFVLLQDMAHLMQRSGFLLPVVDVDHKKIEYQKLSSFLTDVRMMGEQTCLLERQKGLRSLGYFSELEHELLQEKEAFCITVDLLHCHGWAPGTLEAKALRPGQGKVSLTEILG